MIYLCKITKGLIRDNGNYHNNKRLGNEGLLCGSSKRYYFVRPDWSKVASSGKFNYDSSQTESFGPLYTKQVKALADFASIYGIKIVIPFSIESDAVNSNPNVFQVYQNPAFFNQEVVAQFVSRFGSAHPVFIDCNDEKSTKGNFTTQLRKELETRNVAYSITNVNSEWQNFARSFLANKQNVVVLNSEKSPCLNRVISRLDSLRAANPQLQLTLFGYTEWLMYAKYNVEKYCMFDTYIPSHFYYNSLSPATTSLERSYKQWFRTEMQDYLPRFAITGYDHGTYFLRGLHREGRLADAPSF